MRWKMNVWVLAISVTFTASSYTMLVPFLPMYLLEIGVSESAVAMWSGAIFSVSFLVAAILAPFWGKMADKRGKRLMAVRAGFCLGAVYFLGAFVTSPEQLFGVRILQGLANGFFPACLAIASSSAPKEKLGFSLALVQTGQIIGTVLGPLLGGTIAHLLGMRASFMLAGAVLILVTCVVAVMVKEPPRLSDKEVTGSILDDFKYAAGNRMLVEMLLLSFMVFMSNMVLQPVIALYIAQLQGEMEGVMLTSGIVFSLGGVAGAFSATFWGSLGQRKGYFRVMVYAFCGAGIFNFLQFFPATVVGFGVLQFLFGLFIVGANPAISAMMVNSTDPGFRGRVFGLATMANQSGAMVGPLVGSAISTALGIQYVFLFTGPLLLGLGILIYYRYVVQQKQQQF